MAMRCTMQDKQAPVLPTDVDVLCGSGSGKWDHPGNRRFRLIVANHCEKYVAAETKTEKMKVSRSILHEVISPGARFLQKHPIYQEWYIADLKVGRDKISHCLRVLVKAKEADNRDLAIRTIRQLGPQSVTSLDNYQEPPTLAGVGDKPKEGIVQEQPHKQQEQQHAPLVPFATTVKSAALQGPQQESTITINNDLYPPFWSPISPAFPPSLFSMMDIKPPENHGTVSTDAMSACQQSALREKYAFDVLLSELRSFPVTPSP